MGMKFFHLPRNRSFHIPYRFHDPEKEERKEREGRLKRELKIDESNNDTVHTNRIKGSFRSDSKILSKGGFTFGRNEKRKSNQRVFIIILVMLILIYLFFL
ncbi:hypothetical protein K5X82_09760 [Halosquirtibacter xylanolyticus]|uniref:hypothetical protein n=1 Tax=Halosquirtibacter xylanolyticus TaxID=3374599 RepID=UPI00374A5898|nr:hypothetical protein K5X82_09760 [Prolixibacteraceae bacterium]